MTPVTILALIFAIALLLKMLMLFTVKSETLMKRVKTMAKRTKMISGVLLILIAVLGYILLEEINIIQMFLAAFWGMCMYGLFIVQFDKTYIKLAEEGLKNKAKMVLPAVVMTLVSMWVLYAIFF